MFTEVTALPNDEKIGAYAVNAGEYRRSIGGAALVAQQNQVGAAANAEFCE
jgi:hypothetical protein